MRKKKIFADLAILLVCFLAVSCAGTRVQRVESDKVTDLSGQWNDTDSRLVSEEMINDCVGRPWVGEYLQAHSNKKPTVIVGTIQNRSHEHINVQTFVKDMERALINSGKVRFVASKEEREEIRDERKDQGVGFVSEDTRKQFGKEVGADFMLKGTINSILDEVGGDRVVFYQVNLELVDIENNVKAWIGEKKIKKIIDKSSVKW